MSQQLAVWGEGVPKPSGSSGLSLSWSQSTARATDPEVLWIPAASLGVSLKPELYTEAN